MVRVISLGFPLVNPQFDNHSLANAPSLFDYDACLLDLRTLSRQIEEILAATADHQTPERLPVLPGAGGAFTFGLADLIQQRQAELQRLVDRGGVILVFGYANVPHPGVPGLPGAERYSILPAAPGVIYRPPQLLPGDGTAIEPLSPQHPCFGYFDDLRGRLRYHAVWDVDRIPAFDQVGTVIARSRGGAAVGVDFRVGAGRVIFLPPPAQDLRGDDRRSVAAVMLESVLRVLDNPAQEAPPVWLRRFALPGLAEAETAAAAAATALETARQREQEAAATLAEAEKYRALLWRGGAYAFAPAVRDAFRALGFTVTGDAHQATELRDASTVALLEMDAALGTVAERAYLTLQRRIEEDFLRSGVRRKGLIVVNGERLADPASRRQPYTPALKNACENFGYGLITADALFTLVTYALEDADTATLADIRRTILNASGLLVVQEREPEPEPAPPARPAADAANHAAADAAAHTAAPA